ncbi:hypothetical protein K0U07_02160 [bacterium]|nr:hypothetical protein [bacterium]
MKKIFLFLLPISFLLAARVAVIGYWDGDAYITDLLKKALTPLGHHVRHETNPNKLIYYDLIVSQNHNTYLNKHCRKTILVLDEPPLHKPGHGDLNLLKRYLKVFTWDHELCGMENFEKYYFPHQNTIPSSYEGFPSFDEKKLVCIIGSTFPMNKPNELYSERRKIAHYYLKHHPQDLDIYGRLGWGKKYQPVFKGTCKDKYSTLRNYRFTYCYDNWRSSTYYITEKIYDAFNCLVVPIYLGSTKITDLVPKEAFIDARDFKNIDHIHHYISNMDEETYLGYINAIIEYRKSEQRKKATFETFHEQITETVIELLN